MLSRRGVPWNITLIFWIFGFHCLLVLMFEWLTLNPEILLFPQMTQTLAIDKPPSITPS